MGESNTLYGVLALTLTLGAYLQAWQCATGVTFTVLTTTGVTTRGVTTARVTTVGATMVV